MAATLRSPLAVAVVALTALLTAGCTATPGSTVPTSTATPNGGGSTNGTGADEDGETEAVWLDAGRYFSVVTWGSSGCVPTVQDATAQGQTITVTLADPEEAAACTADWAPRASVAAVPEGVDPTQDATVVVKYADTTDEVELDGDSTLTGTPGTLGGQAPSAAWFDDDGAVLLTWGPSSCPPIVDSIETTDAGATVTFKEDAERMCTRDLAARTTVLTFGQDVKQDGFQLTLVGDDLDATVEVIGD